ncbi:MAG TPA: hypothetical protein VGQ64_07885 [Candidatus Limnocylindrales bacterium]|jgi:hypothetical protein|nr:hypothetical protein [Candidatus Limnocylindrales bacterium]
MTRPLQAACSACDASRPLAELLAVWPQRVRHRAWFACLPVGEPAGDDRWAACLRRVVDALPTAGAGEPVVVAADDVDEDRLRTRPAAAASPRRAVAAGARP